MFPTCSCLHRRCLFCVIIPPMVLVIRRRCSRTVLRRIRDVMTKLRWAHSLFSFNPVIRQQNRSVLFFIHYLIRQSQGMWFHVKSLHLLYALNKTLYQRHHLVKTSPSSKYHHYARDEFPIFVRRTPKNYRPSTILELVYVAQINHRIFAYNMRH